MFSSKTVTKLEDLTEYNKKKLFQTFTNVCASNGKTSLVQYRTLSFFAFRFKKNESSFFYGFKYKITFEPVRFASILLSFKIDQFASLR
jgi:hypothetical protein